MTGRVVLGIPDDYVEPFLADIVGRFTCKHPNVEIAVMCEPSVILAERFRLGEVDVAVVTDCDRIRGSEILREEPLQWVAGSRAGPVEDQRPLPLALSGPTCLWRSAALAALERQGIAARLFLVSSNYAAIAPVVQAGLALTVLPRAIVGRSHRIIGVDGGLPTLPPCRVGLLRGPEGHSRQADALIQDVRASLTPVPASYGIAA